MSDLAEAASTPDVRGESIVYVANADSHDIAILALDRASGALREVDRHATGGKVMPLAPADPTGACSMRRSGTSPYRVLSLSARAASGRLVEIGSAPLPASMCWISTDQKRSLPALEHRTVRAWSR